MGKIFSIIKSGLRGVDSSTNPLSLQGGYLRHAVNLQFQSGRLKTRPIFEFMSLGLRGKFGGATMFRPSLGISFRPFGPCGSRLATAVNNRIFVNNAPDTGVRCDPMELKSPDTTVRCNKEVEDLGSGDVNLFQAENLLVVQGFRRNTMWWTGEGDLNVSPGMVSDNEQGDQHSHDTFIDSKHRNFLINGAGLGVYWNGRVHQQGPHGIYVGDLIHKRGELGTSDVVLMEEQSCEDSLSTNSRMGALRALEGVAQMNTPNGEGQLVGYYDGGIVQYNTFYFPRASEFDATGKRIESGWDTKQMVSHSCNVVTATGRYAVGKLPRDHFFRSGFGVHVLSRVLGVEFMNDEPINIVSDEVSNILNEDDPGFLHGAAAGCWFGGHRWFMTTGLKYSKSHSSSPLAKGFVSWNKVWGKTVDKTPLAAWEGAWVVDNGIEGIHCFVHTGMRDDFGCFGFLCSDTDKNLWFAAIREVGFNDIRGGISIPVPWALETGRFNFNDDTRTKILVDGRFEGVFQTSGSKVSVFVRTNNNPNWSKWKTFEGSTVDLKPNERFKLSKTLGKPSPPVVEATWFEFRIEGSGSTEITGFDVEISEGSSKIEINSSQTNQESFNVPPLSTML